MRRQDHIGKGRERAAEGLLRAPRLLGEDVERGPQQTASAQRLLQRLEVHHMAAAEVQQHRARLHGGQRAGVDQVAVLRAAIDVQRDHVGGAQQLLQRARPPGVAQRQLLGGVVVDHAHAQRLGHHGELGADCAVAHHAQRLAPHLARVRRRLVPAALRACPPPWAARPQQHDGESDRQLHHRARIGIGGVEHGHAPVGGGAEIDPVRPDAEGAHGQQPVGARQHGRVELGLGAHAQHVHAAQALGELGFRQGPATGLDGVAGLGEQRGGVRVDALQEQHADLFAGIAEARAHRTCSAIMSKLVATTSATAITLGRATTSVKAANT
jgi:hypothetical protein